jgi:hypothetical protein
MRNGFRYNVNKMYFNSFGFFQEIIILNFNWIIFLMNQEKNDELLSLSWKDELFIQNFGLTSENVKQYFCQRSNPFFVET